MTNIQPKGILPPKDYQPDKFAGLGPELSPQEKLKKKYEDLKKPKYLEQDTVSLSTTQPEENKTFKQKVVDVYNNVTTKVKNFFKNLFHKKEA